MTLYQANQIRNPCVVPIETLGKATLNNVLLQIELPSSHSATLQTQVSTAWEWGLYFESTKEQPGRTAMHAWQGLAHHPTLTRHKFGKASLWNFHWPLRWVVRWVFCNSLHGLHIPGGKTKTKQNFRCLLSQTTGVSMFPSPAKVFLNATRVSQLNYSRSSQNSAHRPLKKGPHESYSTFQPAEVVLYRPHWLFRNVLKRRMRVSLTVPLIMCNRLISENCHRKEVWKANEWTFILPEANRFFQGSWL